MAKFVPRQRKHKVRKRDQNHDSNAIELPSSSSTKRMDLKASMCTEQPNASSKKRKRMDRYIDKKIRKDETAELIRKLEKAHASKATQQGVTVQTLPRRSSKPARMIKQERNDSLDESVSSSDSDTLEQPQRLAVTQPMFGSGLKRPSDGTSSSMHKRQRLTQVKSPLPAGDDTPWEGFGSDDEVQRGSATSPAPHASSEDDSQDDLQSEQDDGTDISSDDDEGGSNETDESDEGKEGMDPSRTSAFKAWAAAQMNEAVGFTPTATNAPPTNGNPGGHIISSVRRTPESDPLPPELQIPTQNADRKSYSIAIHRKPAIQDARLELPIVGEEQRIMEAIHHNPVVVIRGATGSGKTTQIPQFLYEAGFGDPDGPTPGMIGITQPRRVAAVSMAQRVADELNLPTSKVAYQIRYDATTKKDTAIKFMTDGILLREIANDFLLTKYSIIVVDEAHERTVNTDVLIGMLTRSVALRNTMHKEDPENKPCKLIIMSATLRLDDFMENPKLFKDGKPPLLEVEGRQHSVDVHFARRTQMDYLEETFQKICKGHKKLPPGGMLVFLTGQLEINTLAKRLKEALTGTQTSSPYQVRISANEAPIESDDFDFTAETQMSEVESQDASEDDGDDDFEVDAGTSTASSHVHILPLYSMLPTKEQLRVFDPPPEGSRLIVLATNIAETSLTIPEIRYVFDSGREKQKKYNHITGVQSFEVGWISKASAEQRKGRAGRSGPGHCYRLYSSAIYERDFEAHSKPEILSVPIEGVVLQLKSMHIPSVINFPFPTPPDRDTLAKAERLLKHLGAITARGEVTKLGHQMAHLPLSPRFSKMLTMELVDGELVPYVIRMVAALATPELLVHEAQFQQRIEGQGSADFVGIEENSDDTLRQLRQNHHQYSRFSSSSDAIKLMTALGDQAGSLNPKALKEANQLQTQLKAYAQSNSPHPVLYKAASTPSNPQLKSLHQIVAAAFLDQIAIRADKPPQPPSNTYRNPHRAIDVPYLPLTPIHSSNSADLLTKAVFIHPNSILARLTAANCPEYIIYSHLQRSTTTNTTTTSKTRMHALTAITEAEILRLARGTTLLEYSKPLRILEDKIGWRVSMVVPMLVGPAKGMSSWPLPTQKVRQKKVGLEWEVEKVWEGGLWR